MCLYNYTKCVFLLYIILLCNHMYLFILAFAPWVKIIPSVTPIHEIPIDNVATRSWQWYNFTLTIMPSIIKMPSWGSICICFIRLSSYVGLEKCDKICLCYSLPSHFLMLIQNIKPLSCRRSNNISYTWPPRS